MTEISQMQDFNLYFVLPNENASCNQCSHDMRSAFESLSKYGGVGEWVKPSFCLKHSANENDVFVFDKFEGPAFEELKKHSRKVLGARCLLTCLADAKSIPVGNSPVFTEGMRDLIVCCSGFDSKTKQMIEEKIEYMGGLFDKALRNATTHIVVLNNLSAKAMKAATLNIPTMKIEWVQEVWEKSCVSNVHGNDSSFSHLKAPILHNLSITTSGIVRDEKEKIKNLIKKHGGKFTGEMEESRTNIVIISKPTGDKYKFAVQWKIPCVVPDWLYTCDKKGHIVNFENFKIDLVNKPKSSTPKKDVSSITANFSMISRIDEPDDLLLRHVNETTSSVCGKEFQTPRPICKENTKNDLLISLPLEQVKEAGKFLDGFNIFLYGFNSNEIDKLKKILNLGGATRFDEFSSSVTHIIVGKKDNELQNYKKVGVIILNSDWLLKSIEIHKPAPEEQYLCYEPVINTSEPPSPLTKQGARLLSQGKIIPSKLFQDDVEEKLADPADDDDLIQKYNMESGVEAFRHLDELSNKTNCATTPKVLEKQKKVESEKTIMSPQSYVSEVNEVLFEGLKFYISNELLDEQNRFICELITERGGLIVGKRFGGIPDFAVVPIEGAILNDMTCKEVVTLYFIVECCKKNTIVPFDYYHHPVNIVKDTLPLEGCVITVSNYINTEREFIENLISTLGAVCQSSLARKNKDNTLKSTHLVCMEARGPKYNGALRWGLPIVNHEWLFKCASSGKKVSEGPYLVGESKISDAIFETTNVTRMKSPLPAKTLFHDDVQTPIIPVATVSKILNSTKTNFANEFMSPGSSKPSSFKENCSLVSNRVTKLRQEATPNNSPEMNRTLTPTSPYGAFYGNDNPSPTTRKRLLRWMNQGADFPQDPPTRMETPEKSTPISKVLSRYLESMKRPPEEVPPDDSPVAAKKLHLDTSDSVEENDTITAALKRMKEIEDNYVQLPKEQTPVRKSKEFVSAPQYPMVVYQESQPHTEIGWEDPREKEMALKKLETSVDKEINIKVFMLSGFSDNIDEVKKLIEESGGKLSSVNGFDINATHLIATNLARAEKVMGSICAGFWVLHPSYLDELRYVKSVYAVSEEDYEWGNPNRTIRLESLPTNAKECAQSCYYWRIQRKNNEPPPFQDMKILLHVPELRYESFKKMIEAGGGEVIKAQPPYESNISANLCICDVTYKEKINMASLSKQNILCVTQSFVSDKIFRKLNPIEHYFVPGFSKT